MLLYAAAFAAGLSHQCAAGTAQRVRSLPGEQSMRGGDASAAGPAARPEYQIKKYEKEDACHRTVFSRRQVFSVIGIRVRAPWAGAYCHQA
jgi:hypothetical protein